MATEGMDEKIKELLETPFWIPAIATNVSYESHDDDTPCDEVALLQVIFSADGDAWVNKMTDPAYKSIRKRTYAGGGKDLRTRTALMILAYAIKLDEENPKF